MPPIIQVDHLFFTYPDGTPALFDIHIDIEKQEFIAFIGQNGSGKTTLSKCLNGLFKPTSGSVNVEGIDTKSRGVIKQLVTKVGYVFQNPDHQLFNRTVWSEIAYGPHNLNLAEAEVKERVEEAARIAGVSPDIYQTHPYFLPKGLRQRVAIASILAMRPNTIIVDEPTTGQDMRQSIEVMNFLRMLCEKEGHTIIIITHEMQIVADYTRRTVVLGQGRVLLDAPTPEVFADPETLKKTFVAPPQITRLGQALSEFGVPPSILSVSEMQDEIKKITG